MWKKNLIRDNTVEKIIIHKKNYMSNTGEAVPEKACCCCLTATATNLWTCSQSTQRIYVGIGWPVTKIKRIPKSTEHLDILSDVCFSSNV